MLKRNITIILILIIFIYMLFSTKFINNKTSCSYRHILYKDILDIEIPGNYKLFNPSICEYKDRYVLCSRYSNKIIKNIFLYMYSSLEYESHICFIILSKDMKVLKTIFPKMHSKYLEDPRISFYDNKFYVSITEFIDKTKIFPSMYVFDNEFNFIHKQDYNWDNYFKSIKITPSTIQKNFCPFIFNNKLLIHTDTFPMWNVFDLNCNNVVSFNSYDFFKDSKHEIIRCSTSWKSFTEKTFICGLHTKTFAIRKFLPTIRTILVEIDKETLIPIRKTQVLCFDRINNARIQFLSGLETDNNNIYLTFGIGDHKIMIKRLPKTYVNRLLN